MIPTSIDGTDITGATIDGTDVQEITVDGDVVFIGATQLPTQNLIHRYDFSAASTTTTFVEDLAGSDHLTTGSFQGFRTLNGLQVGDFDNDFIEGSWSTTPSEPFSYAAVVRFDTDTRLNIISINGINKFLIPIAYVGTKNEYFIYQGNQENIQGPDPKIERVYSTIFDNTDELFIDGVLRGSVNAGSDRPDGIRLGDDHQVRGFHLNGIIAEVLVYDSDLSSAPARSDVEAYLGSKWGITI